MGNLYKNAWVQRGGKWKVTEEEYSGAHYPVFCPGFGLLFSRDTVILLVKTFPVFPFFRLDDVYIGMLANKTGIKVLHNVGFELYGEPRSKQCIPKKSNLVRHGIFEGGGNHGDCFFQMFNQATDEMFKNPGVQK